VLMVVCVMNGQSSLLTCFEIRQCIRKDVGSLCHRILFTCLQDYTTSRTKPLNNHGSFLKSVDYSFEDETRLA